MSQLSEHDSAVLNCILYPNLPFVDILQPIELIDEEINAPNFEQAKQMEIEAVQLAEMGKIKESLTLLDNAIAIAPTKASIYNNKGQILQYDRKFDEAFTNLSKAIDLSDSRQRKTLSQALCQRGLLFRKISRFDKAKQDFTRAAELGSQFAKTQLVALNPYAALCNQMLSQISSAL